jgi:MFS transporter, DHA1 family, multidrug resistance protein
VFSVVLLAATWFGLPETHPPEQRLSLRPRRLLRDYAAIFANPRFQRLAAAGAFNFAALFLYIASAPAFVLDLLRLGGQRLDEGDFAWFFVPMIGGMMLGAYTSGRAAGRISGARLVHLGFACCGLAALGNVAYNLVFDVPELPWAVMPMVLNAFGIALVFPILTLSILDMYPRQRGSASSLQAFTGLILHSLVAGAVSPLVSHDPLWLALVAATFTALGWLFWHWEMRTGERVPECAPHQAAGLEPTDRL